MQRNTTIMVLIIIFQKSQKFVLSRLSFRFRSFNPNWVHFAAVAKRAVYFDARHATGRIRRREGWFGSGGKQGWQVNFPENIAAAPVDMGKPVKIRARLDGIQIVRGLSAVLVVIAHANLMMAHGQFYGQSPYNITYAGQFGVTLFFIISGFIIVYTSLSHDLTPRIGRVEFARRRWVRIVPFLWLMVVAYNLMSLVGTHQVEWLRFGRALAVWPVGELKPNIVWSLRHEFLFYALFALTVMGARRRTWLLALWFVAPLALWPVLYAFGFTLSVTPDWPTELMSVVLLGAWTGANLQFGVGFVLGVLALRSHALVKPRRFAMVATVIAVAAAAVIVELAALPIGLMRSVVWTVCAAPPVWLSLMVGARQQGMLGRLGVLLGDASFAIYLTHNTVILLLFNASKHLHRLPPPIAFHTGLTVIALAAGMIVHRLVERPLIAWFSSRFKRPGVAAAG